MLNISEEKIGIFISGGTDSTLLAYMLLNENKMFGKNISFFCIPKFDGAQKYAIKCVRKIEELLNIPTQKIYIIGDPFWDHTETVQKAWQEVLSKKLVDRLFLADNITPPNENFPGLAPIRKKSSNAFLSQPFFELTKDEIIIKYYELGIEELLLETHTCTEQNEGECGICWQCSERAWAFNMLNKKDPLFIK